MTTKHLDNLLGPMVVQADGTELVQRAAVNFASGITATDNEGDDRVDITTDLATLAAQGVVPAIGTANEVLVSDGAAMSWAKVAAASMDPGAAFTVPSVNAGGTAVAYGLLGNDNMAVDAAVDGYKIDPDFGSQIVICHTWRSEEAPNVETLGAAKVLVLADDTPWQKLDATAAGYTVELPAVAKGAWFRIYNFSAADVLAVLNPGGASTLVTIAVSSVRWVVSSAAAWIDMGP